MDDYRRILRRVGNALLLLGLADIAMFVVSFVVGTSYASSLCVLGILGGIRLRKGNLATARWTLWVATFLLGMAPGLIALAVDSSVTDWRAQYRASPFGLIAGYAAGAVIVVACAWLVRELRRTPVTMALAAEDKPAGRLRVVAALGLIVASGIAAFSHGALHGETAQHAIATARALYGTQYAYSVNRVAWHGDQVTAELIAFNDQETKVVSVEFTEQ